MKYFTLFVFLVFFVSSCEPPLEEYQYEMANFIELKKDPCFGTCPVYNIKINGKGEATFNGKRNVSKDGTWYRVLSASETNELFKAFESSNFWAFKDEYTAPVTDLPTTWVTFVLGEKSKTIKDYHGAPEALNALEEMVEQIAEDEENWKRELSIE